MERTTRKTGLEAAFSPEGYIVDQGRITDVAYGCRPTSENGCGWIAVFNLLKSLGEDVPCREVAAALERRSLFHGRFGTSPWRIRRYLKKWGWVTRWAIGKKRIIPAAAEAPAGVVIYRHSRGWHFAAFARRGQGEGVLRFYNAVAGNPGYDRTMEAFLAAQSRGPVAGALLVAGKRPPAGRPGVSI